MKMLLKLSIKSIVVSVFVSTSILGLILIVTPHPFYSDGLSNLEEIQAYAASKNEYISPDTDNTIKPNFTHYYKTLMPTWKTKIKNKILWWAHLVGLYKRPYWSPSFFKTQLTYVATSREARYHKNAFICKIETHPDSQFVIFGNVLGAFHSLVRCLVQLKEMGIISNSLTLTNPHHYIIFMGDIPSRSAFSMETLSLVMKLVQLNPTNVIYLKGNHETASYWQEHTLKTELQMRAAHLDASTVPLSDDINRVFNTLPQAVYLTIPGDLNNEFIRCSDSGRDNETLNEQTFAPFLIQKSDQPYTCFSLSDNPTDRQNLSISIRVIFKGEKKRETFQPTSGLRLLPSDKGSIAWTVLSCPTVVVQKALKFFNDAFVVVKPARSIDEWTITLHHHDVRTKDPFKVLSYYLLAGTEIGKEQAIQQETVATIKPIPATQPPQSATETQQVTTPTEPKKPSAFEPIPGNQQSLSNKQSPVVPSP